MRSKLKFFLPATFAATSLLVLAAVIGPYYVGAGGPDWAQVTHKEDIRLEYDAAENIFTIYVEKALTNPSDRLNAIRDDYLRITYYDNTVVDFKIVSFGARNNLRFEMIVSSRDAPSKPSRLQKKEVTSRCGAGSQYMTTRYVYDTGYWGVSFPDPVVPAYPGTMIGTPQWVGTGQATVFEKESCK